MRLFALLMIAPVIAARAQDSAATSPPPDHSVTQRAWVSAGVGLGQFPHVVGYGIAGVLEAVYAPGPVVIVGRTSGAAQIIGDGVSDRALLLGLRTHGPGAFVMAAAGIGSASHTRSCDGPCGPTITGPHGSALAYEAGAEANAQLIGIGLTLFGELGSGQRSYTALALTVQLGWLGSR
jgi:hypothetical protein